MSNKWQPRSPSTQHRYGYRYGTRRTPLARRRSFRIPKLAWLIPLAVLGVFALVNAVTFAVYSGRTYPRTKIMDTTIGSVAFSGLEKKVSASHVLPDKLTLQHDSQKADIALADLGITANTARAITSAKKQRHWLPVVNFFRSPVLLAPIHLNPAAFDKQSQTLATTFSQAPVNARLHIQDGAVSTVAAKNGYALRTSQLENTVITTLDSGQTTVAVPTEPRRPTVSAQDLQDEASALDKQLATPLQFRYNGAVKTAGRVDIGGWYVQKDELYVLSPDKLQAYLVGLGKAYGISIKDRGQVAASITNALTANKPLDLTLAAVVIAKTYTYCTTTRGVDNSHLPTLRTMLETTYGDSRGWSVGGLVSYKYVTTGCDFTVWLSAASQMPSFGAICDADWSCRVGPNVVINFDRWQGASAAWNEYGGSLTDYRHMVINHETGHWLGFGHAMCAGAGQVAAVMQQQSISLQGCTFNPWPTASEQATLRNRLGI